ncbi:MAG: class I SAM-dependent methyltransferase [Bacillota bacterium]|nr:class I SAM-dependent methyltransferase [Bacillota bacterium]
MLDVKELAKCIIEKAVRPGDKAIDATVGKGYDTAFLAGLVGERGCVYGFDIQEEALCKAKEYLASVGLDREVILIQDGHQHMNKHVHEKVRAVMFNLGYLPGGNHEIKTKADTTIIALEKSLDLLLPGGLITIASYTGHPGGEEEKNVLKQYVTNLSSSMYKCVAIEALNQGNSPPVLFVVEKKGTGK